MTFGIMTLSINDFRHYDTQHTSIDCRFSLCLLLQLFKYYSECRYAECRNDECRYAE
jgi:hypothetical protein